MPNLFNSSSLQPEYKHQHFDKFDGYRINSPLDKIVEHSDMKIYSWIDDYHIYTKLVDISNLDDIRTLSFGAFETLTDMDGFQAKLTKSFFEGQGYMKYLFDYVLKERNQAIVSDFDQTFDGSRLFWKGLMMRDDLEIYLHNRTTKESVKYVDHEDTEIWGMDNHYFVNGELNIDYVLFEIENNMINHDFGEFLIENSSSIQNRKNIVLVANNVK